MRGADSGIDFMDSNLKKKNLKKCDVLVTPTSFARYDKSLALYLENLVGSVTYNMKGKPLKENELAVMIENFDGLIAGLDEITEKVIMRAKKLKVISRYGTGVDNVDLAAAERAGIFVTNTPGANSVSVAELAIGLAIAALRSVVTASNKTKNGMWPRISGSALYGKCFGIIGLGNIGKEVALRLKPFNVKILAYDINKDPDFAEKNNIEYVSLKKLLGHSDIVSLHIPVFEETRNLINTDTLKRIKRGAVLINTSRGELVDEDALYESLVAGHLKAAALDAFKSEPPEEGNKLMELDNVILTPHMGAATDNASDEMTRISIEECISVLKGEKPRYPVVEPAVKL